MVKRNKSAKAQQKRKRLGVKPGSMDTGKYLRLLGDPCNAEITHAPYLGTGSGYLIRTRQVVQATNNPHQDFVIEVKPSGHLQVPGYASPNFMTVGYATLSGGSLGNATGLGYPSFLTSSVVGQFRAVAGCVQYQYTGAELNRKGLIGSSIYPGEQIYTSEPISASAPSMLATSNRIVRIGSEQHEVRWVPNSADQSFISANQPGSGGNIDSHGNSIRIVVAGQAGNEVSEFNSYQVVVTFVWEWVPNIDGGGITPAASRPTAGNLNSVMSAIGDVVSFATSPEGRSRIAGIAASASRIISGGIRATALLTM